MRRAHAKPAWYTQSITLENPTDTADGDGGYTQSWTALSPSPDWASIEPATARVLERLVAHVIESKVTHRVEMRYHSGVTTRTRITFGTRSLFVRGVQNIDEADEVSVLACEEVVS